MAEADGAASSRGARYPRETAASRRSQKIWPVSSPPVERARNPHSAPEILRGSFFSPANIWTASESGIQLATAGARRAPGNRGARRYPVAPARQPVFRFENRAAGNGRRLTQLAEKRRRHRLGGEFPVLVAVAGRIKHLPF